jgi:hypothetical protein
MMALMAGDTKKIRYAAVAAIYSACLVACGQDASPPPAGTVPKFKTPSPPRRGPSAEELTAGMAAAPTIGKSPMLADLKFELAQRPTLGQVLQINLALVPKLDGNEVTVKLSDSPGLDAAQDDTAFDVVGVMAGAVYRHTLHVTPTTEGVLLLNLTVSLNHDEVDESQAFSVPIIVDR